MVGWGRFDVIDVEPGSRDAPGPERGEKRGLVDDRSPRSVDQEGVWLHQGQLGFTDETSRALREHQVDRDDVGLFEQSRFLDPAGTKRLGGVVGEILAPRNDLHAKHFRVFAHALSDPAETEKSKRLAGQRHTGGGLPRTVAHAPMLFGQVAHGRDQQPPGEFRSGVANGPESRIGEVRVGDQDAAVASRGHVQVGQAPADDGDQLQVRQPLDERARKRHALAQRTDHIEGPQLFRGLRLRKVTVENGYLATRLHRRPVGEVEGHPGVVVEYRHPGHGSQPSISAMGVAAAILARTFMTLPGSPPPTTPTSTPSRS